MKILLIILMGVCLLGAQTLESLSVPRNTISATQQSGVKTYKVVLTHPQKGSNREVYIQAKTSWDARDQAKDQNPGWAVLTVTEVK